MKKNIILFILLLSSAVIFGQTKIKADEIIRKIDNGEKVYYKNIVVTGNLHLYDLKNLGHHKGDTYHSYAKAEIIFEDCTFRGKVLGYLHDDIEKETYAIQFEEDVRFVNCIFRKGATFKYTEFGKNANFSGSKFRGESVFKYAFFRGNGDFSGVNFMYDAIFKYSIFDEKANFSKAVFEREANFKYTKFEGEISFKDTEFDDDPIFKYARIKGRKAKNKLYKMVQ